MRLRSRARPTLPPAGRYMTPNELNDEDQHHLRRDFVSLDFNHANLSIAPINVAINEAIERAAATVAELPRPYLGASIVGHECLRRIQYDWWCKPSSPPGRAKSSIAGTYFEARARQHLVAAGFKFAPPEVLAFTAARRRAARAR